MDILCKCGHSKKAHRFVMGQNQCELKDEDYKWLDDCEDYVPDNLKTIETLAKKRKLI